MMKTGDLADSVWWKPDLQKGKGGSRVEELGSLVMVRRARSTGRPLSEARLWHFHNKGFCASHSSRFLYSRVQLTDGDY